MPTRVTRVIDSYADEDIHTLNVRIAEHRGYQWFHLINHEKEGDIVTHFLRLPEHHAPWRRSAQYWGPEVVEYHLGIHDLGSFSLFADRVDTTGIPNYMGDTHLAIELLNDLGQDYDIRHVRDPKQPIMRYQAIIWFPTEHSVGPRKAATSHAFGPTLANAAAIAYHNFMREIRYDR